MKKIILIGFLIGSFIQSACGAAENFVPVTNEEKEVVQFWIDICKNGNFTRQSFESMRSAQEFKKISTLLQSLPKDRRQVLLDYQFTDQEREEIDSTCQHFSYKNINTTDYSVLHYAVNQENLAAIFFLIFHGASCTKIARKKGVYELAHYQNIKDYLMVLEYYFRLSEFEPVVLVSNMSALIIGTIRSHIQTFYPNYHGDVSKRFPWVYSMQILQRLSAEDRHIIFDAEYRGATVFFRAADQFNWGIVALLLCVGMPAPRRYSDSLEYDAPGSKRIHFLLSVYEACFETVQTEKGFELCLKK